jgi:hypothetical protein
VEHRSARRSTRKANEVVCATEPSQALVDGEFSYVGNIAGRFAELQELVALVEQGESTYTLPTTTSET